MTALTPTRRDLHRAYAAQHAYGIADWPALGTTAQLVVTDASALHDACAAVEQVLLDIDLAASRFRPDSELALLNAASGDWVPVSPLLACALRIAIDAADWTDGLVDPTVGGVLVDHGYDRTFTAVAPDGPLVIGIRDVPGRAAIELDEDTGRARVRDGAMVDLGATAKALAADLASTAALEVAGGGVLVSLGGDIGVGGDAPDGGWPITVTDRSDLSLPADDGTTEYVAISEGALATSSTRARRWRRGGHELHHLIDPRSGGPANGPWRTVSVTAKTCTLANTASTAAIIAGHEAEGWLSARGLAARLVAHDGAVVHVGDWPES
ncbi:MAG TPA: FAD:protein FMN transferase [Mycobacteriales bacterium]|jgi:thiamine biosynthesis lipoprotein|nr:FAD:protein FMN transferase [Mycobacteriales bacterium]